MRRWFTCHDEFKSHTAPISTDTSIFLIHPPKSPREKNRSRSLTFVRRRFFSYAFQFGKHQLEFTRNHSISKLNHEVQERERRTTAAAAIEGNEREKQNLEIHKRRRCQANVEAEKSCELTPNPSRAEPNISRKQINWNEDICVFVLVRIVYMCALERQKQQPKNHSYNSYWMTKTILKLTSVTARTEMIGFMFIGELWWWWQ